MKKLILAASLAFISFASCNMNSVKGNGHVISKAFSETGFRDIDVSSALEVHLRQGTAYSIQIDGEENLLQLMKVRKDGEKLIIGFKDNVSIRPTKEIKVYITAPDFHNIEGSGACNITSEGNIKGNELLLDLSGASKTDLDVTVNKLKIDASGASEIAVRGKAVYFDVEGSGNTSVSGFPLMTENSVISLSGAGDAEVSVSGSLKVEISGAGNVSYKGSPNSIKKDISGAGSVKQVN